MRGTMWLLALGFGILVSSSGCCGGLRGCGRGCGYESCGSCDNECGPACGPVRRPIRERGCGEECGSCGECGNECGTCCQRNFCIHPLRWIGRLFCVGTYCGPSACGSCGEASEGCESCGHTGGHSGCASCNRRHAYDSGEMSPGYDGDSVPSSPVMEPTPAVKAPAKATRRAPTYSYER